MIETTRFFLQKEGVNIRSSWAKKKASTGSENVKRAQLGGSSLPLSSMRVPIRNKIVCSLYLKLCSDRILSGLPHVCAYHQDLHVLS